MNERLKNTVSLVLVMKKLIFKIPCAPRSYGSNFHRKFFIPRVIHSQGSPVHYIINNNKQLSLLASLHSFISFQLIKSIFIYKGCDISKPN